MAHWYRNIVNLLEMTEMTQPVSAKSDGHWNTESLMKSWQVEEKYAYGDCDILSLALNKKLSLPIHVMYYKEDDTYSHSWVYKDGKGLDIWGWRPESEIISAWYEDGDFVKEVSYEWLVSKLPPRQKVDLESRLVSAIRDFKFIHKEIISE